MSTNGESPITQAGLDRVENNLRREIESGSRALRTEILHERELREVTERLGKEALNKAEVFISEKSAEHNNLIHKMERDAAMYVTKESVKKEILFYISIASFVILGLTQILRVLFPVRP